MSYTGHLGRKKTTGCTAAIIIRYIVRVCFRKRDYLYPTYFLLFYRLTTLRIKRYNRSSRIGTQYVQPVFSPVVSPSFDALKIVYNDLQGNHNR